MHQSYSLLGGASNLLGEASTGLDSGVKTENEVNMDASAGISMGSRRGLGKAKHADAQYHWVQERVARRNFRIKKVETNNMLADVLTKPVPEATMNKALLGMSFHFLEGQHQLSLKKWDGLSLATTFGRRWTENIGSTMCALVSELVSVWSQKRLGRRDQRHVQLCACTYMSIFMFVCAAAISVHSRVSQEIRHLCKRVLLCWHMHIISIRAQIILAV